MRKLTREEVAELAHELKPFIESKGWKTGLDLLKEDFLQRIATSQPDQSALREEIYRSFQNLRELESVFITIVSTAELAVQRDAYDDLEDNE